MKTSSTLRLVAALILSAFAGILSAAPVDDNLTVLFADPHVNGSLTNDTQHQRGELVRTVDEILALNPRPKNAVCLGDLARRSGQSVDYAFVKPQLERLTAGGIQVTITTGNHDRRAEMFKFWPEYARTSPVTNRFVTVLDIGGADLVVLDTLAGSDTRPAKDSGPGYGIIDQAQLAWLDDFIARATRPFFIATHHRVDLKLSDTGKGTLQQHLLKSKWAVGWFHGHHHVWDRGIFMEFGTSSTFPYLTVPSSGHWGDIGIVTLRTTPTGATATLHQRDFYFRKPLPAQERPATWDQRIKENRGESTYFPYPAP